MGAHGHTHGHDGGRWFDYPLNRVGVRLGVGVALLAAATIVAAVVLWPTEDIEVPQLLVGAGVDRLDVTVTSAEPAPCIGAPDSPVECVEVRFALPGGGEGSFQQTPSAGTPRFDSGDDIVVADQGLEVDPRFRYFFLDFQRSGALWLLLALFAGSVVLLGRWQGVRSLAALAASFAVLAWFTLPALLETDSPVLVAIAGSAAVAFITLYLTHGVNHLSTVALIGGLVSLSLTGVLAWVFVRATSLTGFSDEDILFLVAGNEQLDVRGVLLAGIIIGTVGVLDDVTVTQAAAVAEIHQANPEQPPFRLYRAALRVGRDHIGSTTNTLVFAYAGAALPLWLLFTQADLAFGTVVTSEIVAIEIVRALVGGIGLVASVPLTTALATWAVKAETQVPRHSATITASSNITSD